MELNSGVWPTMITPYTKDDKIDYEALNNLIEWYICKQVSGLFAVCLSSEMFQLSLQEKVAISKFVKQAAGGRVEVIASGHTSYSLKEQLNDIKIMADTGVDAVVLVSSLIASPDESEDDWKRNMEWLLNHLDNSIKLGLYECPVPYKREISAVLTKWCASTGRFVFLKDTCCNLKKIKAKLDAAKGTELKIYNANTVTLLDSLKEGVAGYSGVMTNFHPGLYVWLLNNWKENMMEAEELQDFLTVASMAQGLHYPVCSKLFLQMEGVNINLYSRTKKVENSPPDMEQAIRQFHRLNNKYEIKFGGKYER